MSYKEVLENALERANLLEESKEGHDYILVQCPFARYTHSKRKDNNPSMYLKLSTQTYYCFSCMSSGELWNMFEILGVMWKDKKLKDYATQLLEYMGEAGTFEHLIEEYTKPREKKKIDIEILHAWVERNFSWNLPFDAKEYLRKERGIHPAFAQEHFELMWDEGEQRIAFIVRNLRARFKGAVGRSITGKEPRYRNYWKNPLVSTTLGKPSVSLGKRILVVEGFMDLIKTYQNLRELRLEEKYTPVCLFKSTCSQGQIEELMEINRTTYILFDGGEDEYKKATKTKEKLQEGLPSVRIVRLGIGQDPADLKANDLCKLLGEETGEETGEENELDWE